MAIIITYDVPSRHVQLKQAMFNMGYTDRIAHNNRYIYLPNTTVYHGNKTSEQALNDLQVICGQLNIDLERCVSTQWGPDWAAIWGRPFN